MSPTPPERPSFAPRNWRGWISVALLWLLAWAPRKLGLALVSMLSTPVYHLATRRRKIAERNIERCFPGWTPEQRDQLVRESFNSVMRMIAETSWCWAGPRDRIEKISSVTGLEHLEKALATGKGVLLVTGHFTCLEIGARIVAKHLDHAGGVYRPLRSPVMEWYQTRGRLSFTQFMISKREARKAVKKLRQGALVWYAPDQDFGPEQSLFAPFFEIQTATLLATHRLPKMTGCAVVPMFPAYDRASGRYTVEILPALEDFPGDDPLEDLSRFNAIIEARVRDVPELYWWIHRRFKTRPEGEAPFYD